jgi:hypothetical protein
VPAPSRRKAPAFSTATTGYPLYMPRLNLVAIAYLAIGIVVAAHHHYFGSLDTARRVGSAILAVAFWPLLFLGISLHIH